MNYLLIYDNLVAKYGTWDKPKGVYSERHRKIPECMGGTYVKGNAFYVPARVHYLSHVLLARIYGGKNWGAIRLMGDKLGRQKSRMYEVAKIEFSKMMSVVQKGRPKSEETCSRMRKPKSEQHRRNISEANKGELNPRFGKPGTNLGKKATVEARKNMSIAQMGELNHNFGKPKSAETKKKMSEAKSGKNHHFFGKNQSEESNAKRGNANKVRKAAADELGVSYHKITPEQIQSYRSQLG